MWVLAFPIPVRLSYTYPMSKKSLPNITSCLLRQLGNMYILLFYVLKTIWKQRRVSNFYGAHGTLNSVYLRTKMYYSDAEQSSIFHVGVVYSSS